MSRVKNGNTKPEMLVRRHLHPLALPYTPPDNHRPGKPDIVQPRIRTVVMGHGCFWHGHEGCKYFVVPKTRTDWWLTKINNNKAHDKATTTALQRAGWRVTTIWECELKSTTGATTLANLTAQLQALRDSANLTKI